MNLGEGGCRPDLVEERLPTLGRGFRGKVSDQYRAVETLVFGKPLLDVPVAPKQDVQTDRKSVCRERV